MTDRLGIEFLSVFGLPPVDHVRLAAELGCGYVSVLLAPMPYNPHGYPAFSLREDRGLRRDLRTALDDTGVQIGLGEGFPIGPETQAQDFAADLDVMAELGVPKVNTMSFDADLGRVFDEFGVFVDLAVERGMTATIEFCPVRPVANLEVALAAVAHVGRPEFQVLIDTMHFVRSGGTADDLRRLEPAVIGYAQLCDAPLHWEAATYPEESIHDRLPPGEGELPLGEVLAALPSDIVVGLEVPMRVDAEAGVDTPERMRRCVAGARQLLDALPAAH